MKTKVLFWSIAAFGLIIGACSGLWWQIEEVEHLSPIYRSLAKLVVTHPVEPLAKNIAKGTNTEFYGTCIETLESAEMLRKARERVHELHPGLKDFDIEVRAIRTKDSGIINILASGPDPKYTQIFLNALLDEYLAFRTAVAEQHFGKLMSRSLQETVDLQKDFERAEERLAEAWISSPPANGKEEEQRLITRLTKLRDMRDDFDLEIKLASGTATQQAAPAKSATLNAEISQTETRIAEINMALATLDFAKKDREAAQARYQASFDESTNLQQQVQTYTDVVFIHERATATSEHLPDTNTMLIAGFVVGAVLGALIGLGAARLLTWRPAVVIPPQP